MIETEWLGFAVSFIRGLMYVLAFCLGWKVMGLLLDRKRS